MDHYCTVRYSKWFELKESHVSAAHAKDIWRSIEKDILPSIESVPIQELKARTLIQVLEPIKARGALETDLLPID
ncbi:prophage cp4-57 integrase domain protein [Yersinia pseudotuberculosis IP 32953]|nr:prophage cp4-57 integrase domain protein [Yersinia pseudotuberculosis IP 32953]